MPGKVSFTDLNIQSLPSKTTPVIRASEIPQRTKVLAASLNQHGEMREPTPSSCPLTSIFTVTHACPFPNIKEEINRT